MTGTRTSGGACGLIRSNAKNLTKSWHPDAKLCKVAPSSEHRWQVVHGCRQLVSWDVGLSPATSATLVLSYQHSVGDSKETADVNRRKVGMTSNHHAPYVLGDTRATMANTKRSETATRKKSHKVGLSSDWSLQLDFMKAELLVIADQPCCGEYVPGVCTHRPSNHESW